MIYTIPPLSAADRLAIERIDELREHLRFYLHTPRRWYGTLRRAVVARSVQGSVSIEGYHASVEDVASVIDDEEPLEVTEETRRAVAGYRDAMTFVIQLAPTSPVIDTSLLKSLHFMMINYDLSKNPGQWRPKGVWIRGADGDAVYEAPERSLVEPLIDELLEQIATAEAPAMVTAALSHLNLVMIHPFSDGNGRMARCLQTLVLARDRALTPEFSSIEAYLGRNTTAYYEALQGMSERGSWSPQLSAGPWVKFCLTAHYRQAMILLTRIRETEALWDRCEQITARHRLPDRVVGALCHAARGWRLWRSLYVKVARSSAGEEISNTMATRDLGALAAAGLLEPVGEKRNRFYMPTPEIGRFWEEIRDARMARPIPNPYEAAPQPHLPGVV